MISENLLILRNIHGYSQETIAEKIGVSRQAYAKWENGTTLPDVEKCKLIADLYGITIDSLMNTYQTEGIGTIPPAPRGKNIWGTVSMNDRGQVVIPKETREKFKLQAGSSFVVMSDEEGIVLLPKETFEKKMAKIMEYASIENDK